ncbi:MAG: hypothetical protein M5U26_01640 [Planctomycetota bacterium]|nr:hypothetical protein [Planctomycetota bacterium]
MPTKLRLAPFTVDITPPVGMPLAYGFNRKTDAPIHLRGVVFDDGAARVVLCAAEIIGLYGKAYAERRGVVARAAGVPPGNVLFHSVHQHDSLRPPSRGVRAMLRRRKLLAPGEDAYWDELLKKIDAAIRAAVRPGARGAWRKVEALATAERRVAGLASNRRLVGPDGKVQAMRWSMTTDPKLQAWPVGRIDPLLRTIGFLGAGGRPLATLHFYATHPMGAYGRNMVSADIPGVALAHLRRAHPGGQHVYFTGCAGNITFGKYTTPSKERNLKLLGARLGEALAANVRALELREAGPLRLKRARFELPLDTQRCTLAKLRTAIADAADRHKACHEAMRLEALQGFLKRPWTPLTRLDLGPRVHVLSLPAETVVEYQLYAQARAPERFLAAAAYGDGSLQYIPTAAMYAEGGYEPTVSLLTPEVERCYHAALDRLLNDLP